MDNLLLAKNNSKNRVWSNRGYHTRELATQNKKPPSNTERHVVDPEGHDPTTFGL